MYVLLSVVSVSLSFLIFSFLYSRAWGSVVVKALRYKSEGPGIDSRSCHWGFFFRSIRQVHVPGVDWASKNEYQDIPGGKGGRWVGVTTLPPSCVKKSGSLNLLDSSRPRRPVEGIFYFFYFYSSYSTDLIFSQFLLVIFFSNIFHTLAHINIQKTTNISLIIIFTFFPFALNLIPTL